MILSTTISLHPSKPKKRNIRIFIKKQMIKAKKRSIATTLNLIYLV